MQRALRESMESNSMRVGTPLSSQVPGLPHGFSPPGRLGRLVEDLWFKIKKHNFCLVIWDVELFTRALGQVDEKRLLTVQIPSSRLPIDVSRYS